MEREMTNDRTTRLSDGEGLSIAHPEDFGVSRDGEGEVSPLKQRIPGTDMAILVKPLVGGKAEEYEDVLESDRADDERVEDLFEEHIIEGIGSRGDLSAIPDYLVPGLIQAVKNSSGHEVFRAVEEQQLQENVAAIEALDGMGDEIMGMAIDEVSGDEDEGET